MPFGYVAAAGTLASIGGQIAGAVGGGGGSGYGQGGGNTSPPPAYQPTAQPQADQYYQQVLASQAAQANNVPNQLVPQIWNYNKAMQANPYAGGAQRGAVAAGNYATGTLAPQLQGASSSLFGLGAGAAPYGQKILQTGFDPQQALYNRTAQQVRDQSNAINAMYGLGSSPAGAGLSDQAMSNFNIDWQNQQLRRQAEAAQGYGGLVNTAGRAYAGGSDIGATIPGVIASGSGLPYQQYLANLGNNLAGINNTSGAITQAYAPGINLETAANNYMKTGQSATSIGQLGAAQNLANQNANFAGLGTALRSLGNMKGLFGSGSGGGTNYGNTPYGTGTGYGAAGPQIPAGSSYGALGAY